MRQLKRIGIYQIYCKESNKRYIGSSNFINKRWDNHKYKLRRNAHCNEHLQSAWNKYGEKAFIFSILEECSVENLIEKETYYVELFKSHKSEFGYNACLPGSIPLTKEDENKTKPKRIPISIILISSKEEIEEFSSVQEACNKYNLNSKKVYDVLCGRRRSHRGYLIVKKDNYTSDIVYKPKKRMKTYAGKPLVAIHEDSGEVLEFNSVTECANYLGAAIGDISNCHKNGWKRRGYFFKYKEDGD